MNSVWSLTLRYHPSYNVSNCQLKSFWDPSYLERMIWSLSSSSSSSKSSSLSGPFFFAFCWICLSSSVPSLLLQSNLTFFFTKATYWESYVVGWELDVCLAATLCVRWSLVLFFNGGIYKLILVSLIVPPIHPFEMYRSRLSYPGSWGSALNCFRVIFSTAMRLLFFFFRVLAPCDEDSRFLPIKFYERGWWVCGVLGFWVRARTLFSWFANILATQ